MIVEAIVPQAPNQEVVNLNAFSEDAKNEHSSGTLKATNAAVDTALRNLSARAPGSLENM